jgi:hypothetical protein
MRRKIPPAFALLIGTLCAWATAEATSYNASGTIAVLRSHDAAVSQDWFQLTGVASLGNCATFNGLVLFTLRDDERSWRHFAMVLSAKRAGGTITAWVDDAVVSNPGGFCYLQYLQ